MRCFGLPLLALTFACNKPPEGGALGINPDAPTTLDDLVAGWIEEPVDPNGDALELTWSWTRDGSATEHTTSTIPADLTARGQVWEATVIVSDGKKEALEVLVDAVTVLNTPPTAEVAVSDTEPPTTEDLVATETVADVDGDSIDIAWAWTLDGAVQDITGPTVPADRTRKGQVWEVTLVAEDQESQSDPASATITIANSAPSIDTATLTPEAAFVDTLLRCEPAGWMDADGDAESYVYAWYINGTRSEDGAWAKGDTVACEITPDDGEALGTPVRSNAITIQNTPPALSALSIDPGEAFTTDVLTPVFTAETDPDGDTLTPTYAWTVDGSPAGSEATLPPTAFVKGQEVGLTLVLDDGEATATLTTSTIIQNTPPVVTSASIDPAVVRTEDAVSLASVLDDADGDAITTTIAWSVNGTVVATGPTPDSSLYSRGDVITAEITPNDGEEDGLPVTTASVTVANTAPTAPTVAIQPALPLVGRALTCVVTADAVDADGDSLTYTATWTRDGTAYTATTTTTVTGDRIPGSITKDSEVWICSVTASDGTVSGPAGTATTTVKEWQGQQRFTPCSATGPNGPTQAACTTAYTGTALSGEVTVKSGIQTWTAPVTGTYRIEAWGAQGESADASYSGGRGARMRGDFSLTAGDTLDILVGQPGSQASCNGGGGGGSFVRKGTFPLLVAGGGGGTRQSVGQNGCDAGTAQQAGTGSGGSAWHGCALKSSTTIGNGGLLSDYSWGSGGGGWSRDGASDRRESGHGGRAFTNGGAGGGTASWTGYGGFGGGGAGRGSCGGGGGGGYSGGDGGRIAGAGGSYNSGTNQSNSAGARTGEGLVTIDLL